MDFKARIIKLFVESTFREEEPLDFGVDPDSTPATVVDKPAVPSKKREPAKKTPPVMVFGQEVRSPLVAKQIKDYMSNIRNILKKQILASFKDKQQFTKPMDLFLRNMMTKHKNRETFLSPVTDTSGFSEQDDTYMKRFEAFMQEWAYEIYLKVLRSFKNSPSIKWSNQHIDLTGDEYVQALILGMWKNFMPKILSNADAGVIFDKYVAKIKSLRKEKKRKKKERLAKKASAI